MFGFNLQKILVLIAIIVVVWYGFKAAGRIKAKREKQMDSDKASGSIDSQDMVQCDACGHYLAADKLVNCGRDECPYS